jgi:hypothetical protein
MARLSHIRRAHVEFALNNAKDVASFMRGTRGVFGRLRLSPSSWMALRDLERIIKRGESFLELHPEVWEIEVL